MSFTVDVPLSDSVLEEKSRDIFREIRCMVCSGEAIADSNAAVASDMRRNIREKIASGMTIEEIKADYSARYGDVILMNPPLKSNTVMLWLGPWLVLLIGVIAACFHFRSTKSVKKP